MIISILLFLFGLVLLVIGAHALVDGASGLARTFKLSSLMIGLTVVAYGTSTPEMAVSALASFKGESDLAIGNVIGSNIFNVLFILGISALITPLVVHKQLVLWDVPIMIGVSIVTWLMMAQGQLSRFMSIILLLGLVAYTIFAYIMGKKEGIKIEKKEKQKPLWLYILYVVIGIVLLVIGAEFLVRSAKSIAKTLGISELIIGLTIVAAGTSLPEVMTSIVAAIKGQKDIAVGNVVGSNIFNILGVLGVAGTIAPLTVDQKVLIFDIPVMIAVAIGCLPIFLTQHKISRWEGVVFLAYYILYLVYLYLDQSQTQALSHFYVAFWFFIVPMTLITIGIGLIRHYKTR